MKVCIKSPIAGFVSLYKKNVATIITIFLSTCLLSGCASLPSSGPSESQVLNPENTENIIPVIDVTDNVARRLFSAQKIGSFSSTLSTQKAPKYVIGPGDALEITIWEAPPAVLFSSGIINGRLSASSSAPVFPELIVDDEGLINLPFAGIIRVAGKTPQQIEKELVRRLTGKANQPQVLVRVTRNLTSNVTIVGEVENSIRMPLTPKGERLLDAIAIAGGVRQPINKVTIQLSRMGNVVSMPLESVIKDPNQNVYLQPGDIITALFQPSSFIVLGATGRNEEINFETQGITLAQALARSGGLNDNRANPQGVFLFRFEEPDVVATTEGAILPLTPEGKVPVVYRVDLKDPASFLVAQNFPIKNKDVLYVANAPTAEMQKFLNILTSSVFTVSSLVNLTN